MLQLDHNMELRPCIASQLSPPLNTMLVEDGKGMDRIVDFVTNVDEFGFDIETNMVEDFFDRRIRTIQIGNREQQYVIDLLQFAPSAGLMASMGNYYREPTGERTGLDYVRSTLQPFLESSKKIKVGHNLSFEYETIKWNLGLRIFGLYDTMLAEKVLNSGKVNFLMKGFWALDDCVGRYCGLKVDKTNQTSFDLHTPLTQSQIEYGGLDTRFPIAIKGAQVKTIESLNLQRTMQIENDAIPAFGDMHLNGMLIDTEKWLNEINKVQEIHKVNIQRLDDLFVPVIGRLCRPHSEEEERLCEKFWREEKDPYLRPNYRKEFYRIRKENKQWAKDCVAFEGEANVQYGSPTQMLTALRQAGVELKSTNDEVLETLEGNPFVDATREFRTTEKVLNSYGPAYLEKNINKNTGRIHAIFDQLGAETGRTSSRKPNCFSDDTEILTNRGWVMLPNLLETDLVAQYNKDNKEISLSKPTSYIKQFFSGDMCHISTEQQIDMLLTPDHDCLLQNRKNKVFRKIKAKNYLQDNLQYGAGYYVGGDTTYRQSQLTLIAALQADGTITKYSFVWTFKKQRKIQRFRQALINEGIVFTEKQYENNTITRFIIKNEYIPEWLLNKKFFDTWIMCLDKHSFNFLAEEIWFWDGCYKRRSMYSSNTKLNSDWVQILTSLSGRRAKLREYTPKEDANLNWQVDASLNDYSLTTNSSVINVPYSGYVYCVSMPLGTVIIRRNNVVAITGNCQNIDKDAAWRSCFIARPGKVIITIDYSGSELRILAEVSGEKVWIDAFNAGWDVHSVGAEMLFGKKWKDAAEEGCSYYINHQKCKCKLHKILRDHVKTLNFGIAYGLEAGKLGRKLKITKKEAQQLLIDYRNAFKAVTAWLEKAGKEAQSTLRSITLAGRIRFYSKPDWEVAKKYAAEDAKKKGIVLTNDLINRKYKSLYASIERQGKNSPIQGLGADMVKLSVGCGYDSNGESLLWQRLEPEFDALLLSSVHDEIVIEAWEHNSKSVYEFACSAMFRGGNEFLTVIKAEVEGNIGNCWSK